MKILLLCITFAGAACTTTTTTHPDGTITKVQSQDPKVVKAISSAVAEAATKAAIEAIQNAADNQP